MRHHAFVTSFALVLTLVGGCGPSPVARNPPPAAPGQASLRFDEGEVVTFEGPVICIDGVAAERSSSPTSLYCSITTPTGAFPQDGIGVLLEMHDTEAAADGTELSTQREITLVRASGSSRAGESRSADTASWDGTLTLTLGASGAPRSAVLDGALSSVFSPSVAMSFNAVEVRIE